MKDKQELDLLQLWFGNALIQSFKTLPKVLTDPRQARREMQRLKRHTDYQLGRTIQLTQRGRHA